MLDLFVRCLNAKYTHTECGGDYAIQKDKDTVYILFECSDGKEDWISNFDFPKTPYKRMNEKWFAHRGFLRVWRAMKDAIECEISNILCNSPEIENIICVGYSHGGALSLLATEDMMFHHGALYNVFGFGFGAPRVIWGNIPKHLKERLSHFYIVRNIPDIVTHVPPKSFGFRNCGNLVRVGQLFKYNPVKAHYPNSYITELKIYMEDLHNDK